MWINPETWPRVSPSNDGGTLAAPSAERRAPTPQACQVSEFASKAHWTQRLSHLSFTALRALPRRKMQQPKSFFTSLSGQCKLMSASGSQGLKFSD